CRLLSQAAVWRHAPARGHCPHPGLRAAHSADGRALRRAGRIHPHHAAERAARDLGARPQDGALRHARRGRGRVSVRSGGGDERLAGPRAAHRRHRSAPAARADAVADRSALPAVRAGTRSLARSRPRAGDRPMTRGLPRLAGLRQVWRRNWRTLRACGALLMLWQAAALWLKMEELPSAWETLRDVPVILSNGEDVLGILASLRRMALGFG